MEPEKLKVIAEGMGKDVRMCHNDNVVTIKADVVYGTHIEYSPHINAKECMEIMEKLSTKIERLPYGEWQAVIKDPLFIETGKTIAEAVCNAAFEFFKELK